MEDLLNSIINAIVAEPDKVSIAKDTNDGTITFTITAAADDVGKIIGKSGKTIKAIRSVLKILAEQEHQWVNIEVEQG